eukprot:TRINITY_DN6310_c0_g1_i1.p1 TRINITY_DN6310_c0_g1~~TRINITY_DN6310_c0_g1_i1.p1  ORF type:complete len:157 (+),score=40.23 TRINITY_DN6310_c0_g1_i1:61-531(+)
MAGGAEKKRARAEAETKTLYTYIVIGINVVYFLYRILWHWSSFEFSTALGLAFFSFVNYTTLSVIFGALETGTSYTYWQDVMFINWFVQVTSMFSGWFWFVYLVIPGYAIYQFFPLIKGYFTSPAEPETPETEDEKSRRSRERRERRATRPKIMRG